MATPIASLGEKIGFDIMLGDGYRPKLSSGLRDIEISFLNGSAFVEYKDVVRKGDTEKMFSELTNYLILPASTMFSYFCRYRRQNCQ